jgi:hypothetical protein
MPARRYPTPSYLLHLQSGRPRAVWTDASSSTAPSFSRKWGVASQTRFGGPARGNRAPVVFEL